MGGFGVNDKDEEGPEEYTLDDAKSWIEQGAQKSASAICAGVYGIDGTGKTGVCLDTRTNEEIKQGKKVLVFDLDGSAGPLKRKYFDDDENIVIFDPMVLTKDGTIDYVSMYNKMLVMAKYLLENQYEMDLKTVIIDGLDKLLKTCVSGDTLINPKGMKPMKIEDYYNKYDDLEVPIKTRDGYERPIEAFVKEDTLYNVQLQDGTNIKMTNDHPMLVRKNYDEGLSYIECEDLKEGMWIARPDNPHPDGIQTNLSTEKCWIIGQMVAEGTMRNGYSPIWCGNDIEEFERKLEEAYPTLELSASGNRMQHLIVKKERGTKRNPLKEDLKELGLWGKTSDTKFIPDEILWGDKDKLSAFLEGYEEGDGTDSHGDYECSSYTASKELADDLKQAYIRFGNRVNVQVNNYWERNGNDVAGHDNAKVGYVIHRTKADNEAKMTPNDVHLLRIESIEEVGTDKVYDFKMPSGNFVAENLVSSNCEMVMKYEDLKINPDARVGQQWDWGRRNRRYYQLLELIKKLDCDRFFVTHLKDKKEWTGDSIEVKGKEIDWHDQTDGMLFQKIKMSRAEVEGTVEFEAKVEKSKGALHLEGSEYKVAKVSEDTTEWYGLNDTLFEQLREATPEDQQ